MAKKQTADDSDMRMPTDDEIAVIRAVAYTVAEPMLTAIVAAILTGQANQDPIALAQTIVAQCRPS
jgi:hypothetical protein